jgi:hypothetical protein
MGELRDRIKAKDDITSEPLDVPEWGVKLEVRSMTGNERAVIMERYMDEEGNLRVGDLYPAVLIAACFDPDTGEKVFDNDDAGWLNEKNSAALERVGKVALRLAGIDAEAKDQMGKGSSTTGSAASTSS